MASEDAPPTPAAAFTLTNGLQMAGGQPQQTQPPAQQARGTGLINTRAVGKPKSFSGKEEGWAAWVFVARGYLDLLGTS